MNNSNGTNVLPNQSSIWCTKCGGFVSGFYSGTVNHCTCPKEKIYTKADMLKAFEQGQKYIMSSRPIELNFNDWLQLHYDVSNSNG